MKGVKNFLVIAGPTGAGESTVTKKLIDEFPNFTRLITATTRNPRNDEKDKIDYFFFTEDRFRELIKKGDILEYTFVENRNVYYGTYKPFLDEKISAGFIVIGNLDIVGAKFYQKNYNATTIFLKPESISNLKERIKKRDINISEEELKKRIQNAIEEIKNEEPFYDYVIVNKEGKLEETMKKVKIILRKENYKLS